MIQSQWMVFELQDRAVSRKTDIVWIRSKSNPTIVLGTIHWYSHWRCYAFFPSDGCLFNLGCLTDIQAQIQEMMEHWRGRADDIG